MFVPSPQPNLPRSFVTHEASKFIYFYIYRALLNLAQTGNGQVSVVANLIIGYLGEFLSLPVVMPLEAVVSKSQTSARTLAAAKVHPASTASGQQISSFDCVHTLM